MILLSISILLDINFFQIGNIVLILALLFIVFKIFESKWSYKISKPYNWEQAVKLDRVGEELKKIERTYHDKVRFYTFWFQIERLKKNNVKGAFAEVGVYKGETARIIHLMDNSRTFYLFDTFSGFNNKDLESEQSSDEKYSSQNFTDTNIDAVKSFISGNENVIYCKGYFPETAVNVKDTEFAFVHLDVDLYKPTLAALQYFYPLLPPEGVIMIHDYNHNWDGIKRAVDEFVSTIPESIVEVADWTGSVLIVKSKSRS